MNKLTGWCSKNRLALIAGGAHWIVTFFLERMILTVSPLESIFNYTLCKLILLGVLVGFWRFLLRALLQKGTRERSILLYALPYLAVLLLWLFLYHPFTLVSDELNLFTRATQLDSFAYWFNYFSGFYWIMGIMVIPHHMGPVFIKLLLQALTCGYVLARQRQRSGRRTTLLVYVLFLLPFVLDQGISAHRLPTYGLLYLYLAAKLLYDRLDTVQLDTKTFVLLVSILAVLAIWRSEGVYLAPLGLILIKVAYRIKLDKHVVTKIALYALIFALIAAPQLKAYSQADGPSLSLRTKPLCGYLLCNMYRNGLTDANLGADYASIDAYLPISAIHEQNALIGDGNYARASIMSYVREGISYDVQEEFVSAVKRVILAHPIIYIKSQLGAFHFLAAQYPLTLQSGVLGLISNLSYQVWIPSALVLLFALIALIRKKWLTFWLCGAGICNFGIVLALMPAAYAKYFYADYLLGYFLLLVGLIWLINGRKGDAYA